MNEIEVPESLEDINESNLTDEEIKDIIRHYDERQNLYLHKLQLLKQDYSRLDEDIFGYIAMHSTQMGGEGGSGNRMAEGLERLLEQKGRLIREYRSELRISIENTRRLLDKVRLVHLFYISLPAEEYQVLSLLYEKNLLWTDVRQKMGKGRGWVVRIRREALEHIREAYARKMRERQEDDDI